MIGTEGRFDLELAAGPAAVARAFGELVFAPAWAPPWKARVPFYLDELAEAPAGCDEIVARFVDDRGVERPAVARRGRALLFLFDPAALIRRHLTQRCVSQEKPFYMSIPFVYDLTSPHTHLALFRLVSRAARLANSGVGTPYPDWPADTSLLSLKRLLDACGVDPKSYGVFAGPWPEGAKAPVCLSHDVDGIDGYENMHWLLDVERSRGVRATYNIPGKRYEVDVAYLKRLTADGFEIGVHGYRHRGETPFLPPAKIDARLRESLERFESLGATGYRSPAMRRTKNLMDALARRFEYDSSVADTENFTAGRDFNGCSLPYPYFNGTLLEIPITVAQDGVLIMLGYSPDEVLAAWKKKIAFLKSLGAPIVVNTHPDPVFSGNETMSGIYGRLLDHLKADPDLRFSTLGELNRWIRSR